MAEQNMVSMLWRDKEARKWGICVLLFVALTSLVLYRIFHTEKLPPPGAKRAVICQKCGKLQVLRIVDPETPKARCAYCGGRVGMAWKCGHCGYEYYIVNFKFDARNLSTMERLRKVESLRRCPNCGEIKDVRPMSVNEVEDELKRRGE